MKEKKFFSILSICIFLFLMCIEIVCQNDIKKTCERNGEVKRNITNQYESFLNFPYESMAYVDDAAFKYIQRIYGEIDFKSNFAEGDKNSYDFYRERFGDLLSGKIPFTVVDTGEEIYLTEYKSILEYDGEKYTYDVDDYLYAFFDMDEDGTPELCVLNGTKSAPTITDICIFKYDKETEKVILWREQNACYYYIFGSTKIGWDWQGGVRSGFYQLDESGKDALAVFFVEDDFNGIPTYMVTLPRYADDNILGSIPEDIETQLYYDKGSQLYYFKVTEEQYYELTADFCYGRECAKEYFESIIVTYSELFEEK